MADTEDDLTNLSKLLICTHMKRANVGISRWIHKGPSGWRGRGMLLKVCLQILYIIGMASRSLRHMYHTVTGRTYMLLSVTLKRLHYP